MKKRIKCSNEKMGKVEIVKDFLPTPEDLVFREENIKVTLNLNKSSVEYFKKLAKDNGSQYEKMIRELPDSYTSRFPQK